MKTPKNGKPYLVPRRYYEALFEVAKAINSSLRVDDVLKSITESTTKAMDAKGCGVLLLSPDKKKLWYGASHGLSEQYLQKGEVLADTSVAETWNERRPVVVKRAAFDWRIQYREEVKKEGIGSILSVPLALKDDIIGILRVYTSDPRVFPQEEIDFVQAIADLAAIALENARLREWVNRDRDKIRTDLTDWYVARDLETFIKNLSIPPQ